MGKVAVEPKTKGDQQKMSDALIRLAAEDPSFRFSRDEETGQTIIEGMGELHLEIIVDRMKREFSVEANVGAPRSHTVRPSPNLPRSTTHTRSSLEVPDNTPVSSLSSNLRNSVKRKEPWTSNSLPTLREDLFLRSTFLVLPRVLNLFSEQVLLLVSLSSE